MIIIAVIFLNAIFPWGLLNHQTIQKPQRLGVSPLILATEFQSLTSWLREGAKDHTRKVRLADYKVDWAGDILGLQFDIALLEMKDHVDLEIFNPACLPRN